MKYDVFLAQMQSALLTVLLVSTPALAIAIIVGTCVGLLQALTQIQDQTLPQAVKLFAVMIVIIVLGPLLAVQVGTLATQSLDSFASLTR